MSSYNSSRDPLAKGLDLQNPYDELEYFRRVPANTQEDYDVICEKIEQLKDIIRKDDLKKVNKKKKN